MLAKSNRVSRSEFSRVFTKGRRYNSPLWTLVLMPGATFKTAVVVSKKVAKKAHDRNRLRRRVYAVLSDLATRGQLSGTVLVITKPYLTTLTKREFFMRVPEEIAQSSNCK